jgi:hypothetical protein
VGSGVGVIVGVGVGVAVGAGVGDGVAAWFMHPRPSTEATDIKITRMFIVFIAFHLNRLMRIRCFVSTIHADDKNLPVSFTRAGRNKLYIDAGLVYFAFSDMLR